MNIALGIIIAILAFVFIWNLVGIFVDDREKKNTAKPSAEKFIEGIFSESEKRK
jgi:hypothetical protein